jgi:predicted nucleic acid-binding protein
VTHLLDTNSCVDHLRGGQTSNISTKLADAAPGSVVLCSIVVAELLYGAHRSAHAGRSGGRGPRDTTSLCWPIAREPSGRGARTAIVSKTSRALAAYE